MVWALWKIFRGVENVGSKSTNGFDTNLKITFLIRLEYFKFSLCFLKSKINNMELQVQLLLEGTNIGNKFLERSLD